MILTLSLLACRETKHSQVPGGNFPKSSPQDLGYENVSILLKDMSSFAEAVKALDQRSLQAIDSAYNGVLFQSEHAPLFVNVYPDPAGKQMIFLVAPKDPLTGANYLLTYHNPLPVVDSETVELQIRIRDPQKPLNCSLSVPDTAAYKAEYESHTFAVLFTLSKKFLQSGTYDFDAMTVLSYRSRGYPFIVFDLVKAELVDHTGGLFGECSQ